MASMYEPSLLAPRMSTAAISEPQVFIDKMSTMFGRTKGLLDSSQLAEKPGSRPIRDWNVVDEKFKGRELVELSPLVTAAVMNEFKGWPLLFFVMQVVVSYERHWKEIFREVIQTSWGEVGPTGIPRTINWRSWSKVGHSTRFKQYVTIPTELLGSPEFGIRNLMDQFKGVLETGTFTVLQQSTVQIAMRSLRTELEILAEEGRQYTYAYHYQRSTEFFCQGAVSPQACLTYIAKTAQRMMPPANCVIIPEGSEWALFQQITQTRVFPFNVIDKTDDNILAAAKLTELVTQPITVIQVAGQEMPVVTMPTLHATADEADEHGQQALRRETVLSRSYPFPTPSYGALQELDPMNSSVAVLEIDRKNSQWHRFVLGDVIQRTGLGYLFNADDDGSNEKTDKDGNFQPDLPDHTQRMIEQINAHFDEEQKNAIYEDIKAARDMNTPGWHTRKLMSMRHVKKTKDLYSWRELPAMMYMDKEKKFRLADYVGQFPEAHLSTQALVDMARSAILTGEKKKGDDGITRIMANLFGRSVLEMKFIRKIFDEVSVDLSGKNTAKGDESFINEMLQNVLQVAHIIHDWKGASFTNFLKKIAEQTGKNTPKGLFATEKETTNVEAESEEETRPPEQQQRPPVNPPPAQDADPMRIEPQQTVGTSHKLFGSLPNAAFELFATIQPVLARYEKEQPEKASALVGSISNRIQRHANDAGHLEVVMKNIVTGLAAAGITPDLKFAASPLPPLKDSAITTIRTSVPKQSELAAVSRIIDKDSNEWSQARAFAAMAKTTTKLVSPHSTPDVQIRNPLARPAPLGRLNTILGNGPNDDELAELSGFDFGAMAAAIANGRGMINPSRYSSLRAILPTLTSDELAIVIGILTTRARPRQIANLARNGIAVIGGAIERYGERYLANSVLLIRRNGEAAQVVVSPMDSAASARSVSGVLDFTFSFLYGCKWNNPRAVREIYGLFPYATAGGITGNICEMMDDVVAIFESTRDIINGRPDCVFVITPFSETRHEYPCHLFGEEEVEAGRQFAPEQFFMRKNSGHVLLRRLVGEEVCANTVGGLDTMAEDFAGTLAIPFCPIVERGATYGYDPVSRLYNKMLPGTGALREMIMNNHNVAATIFNGGHIMWPTSPPPHADI